MELLQNLFLVEPPGSRWQTIQPGDTPYSGIKCIQLTWNDNPTLARTHTHTHKQEGLDMHSITFQTV